MTDQHGFSALDKACTDDLLAICLERFANPKTESPQWLIAWALLQHLRNQDALTNALYKIRDAINRNTDEIKAVGGTILRK